jgi:hypothetical protein
MPSPDASPSGLLGQRTETAAQVDQAGRLEASR